MLRAAKYLNVAPWELQQQSVYWRAQALAAEAIEASVEKEKESRARRAADRAKKR